jgi:hypothetical protein
MAQGHVPLQNFLDVIDYRVARSKSELEKAYTLVYKEYLRRGYCQESNPGLKLSLYNALPETTAFVSVFENEIFSTATLIPDSPFGLPMDELYHQELDVLRKDNKKLCEISMLASDTTLFQEGVSLMLNSKKMFFIFNLFKLIFDYARQQLKLDCICITVNPKHALTYDFLLFKDLGGLKTYEAVNGAAAIGKFLDLTTAEQECALRRKEGLQQMFLQRKTPPEKFSQKVILSQQDLKYFFVERTSLFKNASPEQLDYLRKCYPEYDFSQILK